jgi:hypothetical protein
MFEIESQHGSRGPAVIGTVLYYLTGKSWLSLLNASIRISAVINGDQQEWLEFTPRVGELNGGSRWIWPSGERTLKKQ